MHRVSLWSAVGILLLQLFLAITNGEYFDETIWYTIGLNAIFIVIGIVRAYRNR